MLAVDQAGIGCFLPILPVVPRRRLVSPHSARTTPRAVESSRSRRLSTVICHSSRKYLAESFLSARIGSCVRPMLSPQARPSIEIGMPISAGDIKRSLPHATSKTNELAIFCCSCHRNQTLHNIDVAANARRVQKCSTNELFLLPTFVNDHHWHIRDIQQQVGTVLCLFRYAPNNHRPGLNGQLFVLFEVAVFTCSSQLELARSGCRSPRRPIDLNRRAVDRDRKCALCHGAAESEKAWPEHQDKRPGRPL